jgi:hypothetical protein
MGKLAYFPVVYHIHTEVLFTEVVKDERQQISPFQTT